MRTNANDRSTGRALETYEDDDLATNLIDLLTDARHWCDRMGKLCRF